MRRFATSLSTSATALSLNASRSRRMAAGDMTRCNTLRVRSCTGGSASSTMLLGRQGACLAKSWIPTPRADEKIFQSFRAANTCSCRAMA